MTKKNELFQTEALQRHGKTVHLVEERTGTSGFNIAGFILAPSLTLANMTARDGRKQIWARESGGWRGIEVAPRASGDLGPGRSKGTRTWRGG